MRGVPRGVVVILIGALTGAIWVRAGVYGFGLPIGLLTLILPLLLAGFYVRAGRLADVGLLLGAFGTVWTAVELWVWLNVALDPGVSAPGWTPAPLAAAVLLLVTAGVVLTAASSQS